MIAGQRLGPSQLQYYIQRQPNQSGESSPRLLPAFTDRRLSAIDQEAKIKMSLLGQDTEFAWKDTRIFLLKRDILIRVS